MPAIHVENEQKSIEVLPGTNLRTAAIKTGLNLYSPFFRVFHLNLRAGPISFPCGADVVEVVDGKGTNARSPQEENVIGGRWLVRRKVTPNLRLACQVQVNGDITIRTRPTLEVDREATKQHIGFLAVVGGFFLLMAVIFALIGLDLVKLI
jgi:hypothetical protein